MAQRYHNYRPKRRYNRKPSTMEQVKFYGLVAVGVGLVAAWAPSAWEASRKRKAYLDSLPAGFTFSGCDAVRAAGVAPLYAGEPGFSSRLDGDSDGVGCEPYRGR